MSEKLQKVCDTFSKTFHSEFSPEVNSHLIKVYGCLSISSVVAGLAAGIGMVFPALMKPPLVYLIITTPLGALMLLMIAYLMRANIVIRFSLLLSLALTMGLSITPLLVIAKILNPAIIIVAFLGTALIFISFTAWALVSKKGKFLYLGAPITAALLFLLGMSILSLVSEAFLSLMFDYMLYASLVVSSLLVLFDTQLIIALRENGDDDFVYHSAMLFLDVAAIFKDLLMILINREIKSNKNIDTNNNVNAG